MLRYRLNLLASALTLCGTTAAVGCSSGASGSSGTFNVPPTTTDGSGSDTTPTTGPDDDSTGSSGAVTTAQPDETSSGSDSSSGDLPEQPAMLVWGLDEASLDYGAIPVDGSASTIIVLENIGDHEATSIATGTIPGDFSFPGGYPGTEGTCGTELAAGESCLLDLRFGPSRVGPVRSQLVIDYYDGINLAAPTQTEALDLLGGGQGESENLLVNGDAETGEVDPWIVPFGQPSWDITSPAFGGQYAFTPSGALIGVASLGQAADLSPWQHDTAEPGLRYRVRARARSNNGSHTYRVYVDLGAGFEPLVNGGESSWTLVEHADALPASASSVDVRIECANGSLEPGPCDVSFDDVTLQLLYP